MSLHDGKSQLSKIFLALSEWPGGKLSTLDLFHHSGSLAVSTKVSQVCAHKDFPGDKSIVCTTENKDGDTIYVYEYVDKPVRFDNNGQGGLF